MKHIDGTDNNRGIKYGYGDKLIACRPCSSLTHQFYCNSFCIDKNDIISHFGVVELVHVNFMFFSVRGHPIFRQNTNNRLFRNSVGFSIEYDSINVLMSYIERQLWLFVKSSRDCCSSKILFKTGTIPCCLSINTGALEILISKPQSLNVRFSEKMQHFIVCRNISACSPLFKFLQFSEQIRSDSAWCALVRRTRPLNSVHSIENNLFHLGLLNLTNRTSVVE